MPASPRIARTGAEGEKLRTVDSLTRLERKWCSRRMCVLCEQPLSEDYCGGIFDRCPQEVMDQRRGSALATYRPRQNQSERGA